MVVARTREALADTLMAAITTPDALRIGTAMEISPSSSSCSTRANPSSATRSRIVRKAPASRTVRVVRGPRLTVRR